VLEPDAIETIALHRKRALGSGGVSPMRIKIRLLFAETSVLP